MVELNDYQKQLLMNRCHYVASTIFDHYKDVIVDTNSVDLTIQYSSPANIYISKYENDPGVITEQKEEFYRVSGFYNMYTVYVFPRNIIEIANMITKSDRDIETLLDAVDTITVSTVIHELFHSGQNIPSYNKPEIPEYCKIEDSVHELTLFFILDHLPMINKLIDGNVNVTYIAREFLHRDENRPEGIERFSMYDYEMRSSWRDTVEDITMKIADINFGIIPKSKKRNMNKVCKALNNGYDIAFIIFREDIVFNTTGEDLIYWLSKKDEPPYIQNIDSIAEYLSIISTLGDKFFLNTMIDINEENKTVVAGLAVTEIEPFDPCYFIK